MEVFSALDLRIEKGNGIIICKETREKGACRLQGFFIVVF